MHLNRELSGARLNLQGMSKWKAVAVFFTLPFFNSLRSSLYVYFSSADDSEDYRIVRLALVILVNLLLLIFAVRYWKKAFRADKNRAD